MIRRASGRLAILLAIVAIIVVAFTSGVGELVSLEELKARRGALAGMLETQPFEIAGAYVLLYVAFAALSIPGAAVLTLAGGAIFGLLAGTVLVSFASVLGAVLAFLGSRYLLRDWVRARFARQIEAIDHGLERDGMLYLLSIRLNPVFPYFLVNLAMGLTRMSVVRFALVSQIGMLPATIIYVNAGTQLARIRSLGDVLSPQLIGSLVLVSLLPLLGKWAAGWLRRRRVYKGWRKPRRFDRNLIVIGAGAGGLVTSYIAAAVRAKVTLIEAHRMGGDCLNTGCVPSKALIRAARAAHEIRTAGRFGIGATGMQVDFPAVMARIWEAIRTIEPADSVERYTSLGVDVRLGHARIVDPWTVEIDGGDRLTARSIVIAAGGEPFVPDIPGLAEAGYLTSDTIWNALGDQEQLPGRLVILGGGPIGCEMAQAFARLGSRVTLIERGERILGKEDADVSAVVGDVLRREGVDLRTGHDVVRIQEGRVILDADLDESVIFDRLLVAVGRRPRLEGYGLEALGVDADRPLDTNAWLETLFPNIYAVGDVAGPYQFTHAASHQAWHAAVNALFGSVRRFKVDYSVLPWVTFTDPEVAHVGHNEDSARAAGMEYELVRYELSHLDRAVAEGANLGFVKLLVRPGGDRILGATIVGHNAGELIATVALAMKYRIGLKRLLATVHAYPTMAEATKLAAGAWRRDHAPERLLRWVELYHRWRRR